MAKFTCKYCGMHTPVYKEVGPHTGEWCQFCQRWIRWIPKKELKQDDTIQSTTDDLDKHRADYEAGLDEEVPW